VIIHPPTPLERAIVDQKIAILLLQEGEACAEFLVGLAGTMQLVHEACRGAKRSSQGLKECLNVCLAQVLRNSFQLESIPKILEGLELCLKIAPTLQKGAIAQAWQRMK